MIDINADSRQWSINFFDKKSALLAVISASSRNIKNENISNKELAEELHKQIIRKFKKRKLHSLFIGNIWCVDLADMQLISKFNKGIPFLLCVFDIYSKCTWVIPLKDKRDITIANAFQRKNLKESNSKQDVGR